MASSILDQLKRVTTVVADTGDFDSIASYKPTDATTNPSLILAAAQKPQYAALIDEAVAWARKICATSNEQLDAAIDKLLINFGVAILKIIPGRVSTEIDASLSFHTADSVAKALHLIGLYAAQGISKDRVLIKIAATWEGIRAAHELETKHGVHCNLTLVFNLTQATACAEAGVTLISPFVGRILDWHAQRTSPPQVFPDSAKDPGVISVTAIFNHFKAHGFTTTVMGASFRNKDEIIELAGCDCLTISPGLLSELQKAQGTLVCKLDATKIEKKAIRPAPLHENSFRWAMNADAMATEKLSDGIRKFAADGELLRNLLKTRLSS